MVQVLRDGLKSESLDTKKHEPHEKSSTQVEE